MRPFRHQSVLEVDGRGCGKERREEYDFGNTTVEEMEMGPGFSHHC